MDETSFPKAGEHSVGVARQYCGALGKVANCQVAVTLHWSSAEASCPLGWRLYLPQVWFEDEKRAQEVKLPKEVVYRSPAELALELIDQMLRWEVPRMPVVADSAYGNSFDFREQLRQRQLSYVLAVEALPRWSGPQDPNAVPVPPSAPTGRPRRYPPLEATPTPQDLTTVARQLPASALEESDLACGNARSTTLAFRPAESLGGARLAGPGASRAGRRMAADRMAGRRSGTHQVLAGAVGPRPARSASLGEDGSCALADRDGLSRIERRTRAGSLRGPSLVGLASSCYLGHAGLRLSAF